jgi:PhnB protein
MQFFPYLDFDGDCRDAFDFYARVFDGQVTRRMTRRIAHGRGHAARDPRADHAFAAGEPGRGADGRRWAAAQCVQPRLVNIALDKAGRGRAHLRRTGRGRQRADAAARAFWAQRFGLLTDRYGKGWMVNCLKPAA